MLKTVNKKKREKLLITISSKKEKKPLTGPKKLLYSTRQNDGERERALGSGRDMFPAKVNRDRRKRKGGGV